MHMRRMKVDAVPHGFQSSFRDWAGDQTSFPREIAEAALAHQVGNEVERSYRRGDALEKRRLPMALVRTIASALGTMKRAIKVSCHLSLLWTQVDLKIDSLSKHGPVKRGEAVCANLCR